MADKAPINAVDMDQSPTTMAATAMAAAVANRERQSKLATNADDQGEENDEPILSSSAAALPTKLFNQEETVTESDIQNIWNTSLDAESNLAETLRLLISEIDTMVQSGLGAFHELDVTNRQLVQSKELIETKSREATRIGAVEDQSRASLSVSHLLHSTNSFTIFHNPCVIFIRPETTQGS